VLVNARAAIEDISQAERDNLAEITAILYAVSAAT
jgi:hypothetical protein